jgi:hypothetical protein
MTSLRLALFAIIAMWSTATWAADARLAPHRAAYSLSLAQARSNGVTSIEGAMTVDWQETCDGWTLSQRMRFRVFDSDGDSVDNDITFSSWESRDGLSYRFTMRTTRNGEVAEQLRGRATLDGVGKGGKVVFVEPENEIVELPPGTLFPTEHTLLLIDRVRAGDQVFTRSVFDGASVDGAMDVNAVMGATIAPDAPNADRRIGGALLSGPSWRVRMAFFRNDDQRGSEPEYETSMRLFDNGVGTEFLFDYQEFSIKAQLERLEALPRPRC